MGVGLGLIGARGCDDRHGSRAGAWCSVRGCAGAWIGVFRGVCAGVGTGMLLCVGGLRVPMVLG